MKTRKKILAIVLAISMVLAMNVVAFAAETAPADTSIAVTGLVVGDVVDFYQVLKYDETATATGRWAAAPGFESLTTDEIQQILGLGDYAADGSKKDDAGIDAALAAKIANLAENATAKFADVAADANTKNATAVTTEVGTAGLYVAIVTPGKADYLYNPVFVAADYTVGGSNTQTAATELSYADESLAKKENITLTKELDVAAQQVVNVGDDVNFTITSKVPAYSAAYADPTYVITDTLEAGLEVKGTPVVTIAGITLADGDYTVAVAADKLSFTVTLTPAGLAKVAAKGEAQTITVQYAATLTSVEEANVTEKTNDATVEFSNNPNDATSYSLLEDKTRTYSFTIDGNLLGQTGTNPYETSEIIKVGLNADGTPAFETKTYPVGEETTTELSPLEGAQFTLYSDAACQNVVATATSDANGRLKIEGLDEGTYYLKETQAPNGFIADTRTFTITIAAEYTEIEAGQYTNEDGIVVKYDAYKVLDSYTVTVSDGTGTTTSTYDITNAGETQNQVADSVELNDAGLAGDAVTPISNTKGTELPSTGGIGTTIFYIVGSVLIAAAAIVLITRRRVAKEVG